MVRFTSQSGLCDAVRIKQRRTVIIYALLLVVLFVYLCSVVFEQFKSEKQNQDSGTTNKKFRITDNIVVQKTSGNGWKVWDRQTPLNSHLGLECSWVRFRPHNPYLGEHQDDVNQQSEQPEMCVVPQEQNDIYISESIRANGQWPECNFITENMLNGANTGGISPNTTLVYLDVGANLGSCVMQVITTVPNVQIIAFEPDPGNLFYLTSTLSRLRASDRNRVHLFPVALGSVTSEAFIHVEAHNRGNSIVVAKEDLAGKDSLVNSRLKNFKQQSKYYDPVPVPIERLDDLLRLTGAAIHFFKMDAQGAECDILRGGFSQIFSAHAIQQVWYELEPPSIRAIACSEEEQWAILHLAGFDRHYRYPPIGQSQLEFRPKVDQTGTNYLALDSRWKAA
jgi:FkbM family methyltransferase